MSIPILRIYDENHNPISIPAIKGERGERGAKGAKGDSGGITVKGYYTALAALQSAVPSPAAGDAYGVGAAAPYNIYIWDGVNGVWVNNGSVQGAKGDKGDTGEQGPAGPSIMGPVGPMGPQGFPGRDGIDGADGARWYSGKTVKNKSAGPTAFSGSGIAHAAEGDYYLNTDTASASFGNVYLCTLSGNPQTALWKYIACIKGADGATPEKGVDYWTAQDRAAIREEIMSEIHQGADLGLQIVCQLSRPAVPADNMIWVETETAMPTGKYLISSKQPTAGLVNGFIWIREMYMPLVEITMPDSHVSLSIAQVWQYVSGQWVWKQAHVYKTADTSWHDCGVYWFKEGVGFNSEVFGATYTSDPGHAFADTQNRYIFVGYNTFISGEAGVSPGKYKYLVIDSSLNSNYSGLRFGIDDAYNANDFIISQDIRTQPRNTTVLDISSASANFYPKLSGIGTAGSGSSTSVYNVWLV